ncbi:MAG: LysR family transcriptional regulator [Gammaproteobacteria bacterium]|jgi:DNA-binding transcriptional LysR family regulator
MIELRHLRYFIAVAEELNFRRAAERVHIDQTPLSRTIRDLEERWGVMLFVRAPRRLELTPAGIKLLAHARSLLIRLERTKRAVLAVDKRYREPLRIGLDDCMAQLRLAECLASWNRLAPEIPVELVEMHTPELLAALCNEEVDVAFSFGPLDDEVIVQQTAWTSPMVAILPSEHELAGRDMLSLAELLAFPIIAFTSASHPGLHQQVASILRQQALSPVIAAEARTLSGYLTRVAVGQGVGVADADHMRTLQRRDVVVLPLAEPAHFTAYVLHKHQRFGVAEPVQRFLTHVSTLT